MNVSFELDDPLAERLAQEMGELEQVAKEALAIEAYRQGHISLGKFAEVLGMGVLEADQWLANRGVPLNYAIEGAEKGRGTLRPLHA